MEIAIFVEERNIVELHTRCMLNYVNRILIRDVVNDMLNVLSKDNKEE